MVESIKTDIPKVAAPQVNEVGYTFRLPGGVRRDGRVVREIVMDEMTGVDEENIANPGLAGNGGKIMTALLAGVVKKLGNEKVSPEIIRHMLIGDRDFLLLKLRIITSGADYQTEVECPKCSAKSTIGVDLDAIDVKELADEEDVLIPFTLPKGYRDSNGQIHKDGLLTLPTGVEQEYLSSEVARNMAVATTHLLTRCCKKLGNVEFITHDLIRVLSSKDREAMATTLRNAMPGPVMEATVVCPSCSNKWNAPISVTDFFGQAPRS